MRPTTRELVDAIAGALEQQVAPAVQDKWAASVLRSAVQLLGHIAVRVEDEARVLFEDNADAQALLAAIEPRLAAGRPGADALHGAVAEALRAPDAPSYDTAGLAARNDAFQSAVEFLLRHAEAVRDVTGGEGTRDELRAYLRRRLVREHHLYFPAFTGAPF